MSDNILPTNTQRNTSGQGKNSDIPPGIRGWSWGAFLLTWIWGIGNNTYRAFWCFFPIVNIFMWFALGLKGREWAWQHRKWESVEHFVKTQKRWNYAGFIVISIIVLILLITHFTISIVLNNAASTKFAIQSAQQNVQLQSVLGEPIQRSGSVQGNIAKSGTNGTAQLSIPVKGSKSQGVLYAKECKNQDHWYVVELDYVDQNDAKNNLSLSPEKPPICIDTES